MSQRPPVVTLRAETEADRALSLAIYAATREPELARVPWNDAQRAAFVAQQFEAQRRHYRAHHPDAEWLVAMADGVDAGRLYVGEQAGLLLLIDLAVLPAWRGRGVGRALMAQVLARAAARRLSIRLHVEKDNPVLAWYQRLGFVVDADAGVYWRMLRSHPATEVAA